MGQNFSWAELNREYDDDEQETSTTKTELFAIATRSKAKAKPRRPSTACSSSRSVPILERIWIDFEPGTQIDQAYPVEKRINTLLRHGELLREEDGAIEFWRQKDDLQNKFEYSQCWSDDVWKNKMAGGGGNDKRFQYCTDPSGQEILFLRALQGHSGRNFIDPSRQDNVLILNDFFEYIYHIGCAVNLHSITKSGLIPGGQKTSRDRQTVFFTAVNPMHENHQDLIELDLTTPRLLSYKQKWKVHQDTVYRVDIQHAQRKGLKFCQRRSNAVILHDTLPAYCFSKAIVMKSEEVTYQNAYVSPRPPPTISNKTYWTCNLDSDIARSSNDIQRIELKPNTQFSSTVKPVTRWRKESLERTKFDRIHKTLRSDTRTC